jgi:hypothetical protein
MNRSLLKVFQGNVDVAQPTTSRPDQFPGIAGEVRGDSRYTSPYSMSSMSRPSQRMNVPCLPGARDFHPLRTKEAEYFHKRNIALPTALLWEGSEYLGLPYTVAWHSLKPQCCFNENSTVTGIRRYPFTTITGLRRATRLARPAL